MDTKLFPLTIEAAPGGSRRALEGIHAAFGFVPNLMATFAHSPAVLSGYLALDAAWEKTSLDPVDRQLVLLVASVENGCAYCTAAHSTILKSFVKARPELVSAVRSRVPTGDVRRDALIMLVRELVVERGRVSAATLENFASQGYGRTQAMEVLLGIALKTISNYLDHFNPTTLDEAFRAEA